MSSKAIKPLFVESNYETYDIMSELVAKMALEIQLEEDKRLMAYINYNEAWRCSPDTEQNLDEK